MVGAGVVEGDDDEGFAGVGGVVVIEVVVAFECVEVGIGPAFPLFAAGELVADVDHVGDAAIVVAKGGAVAWDDPGFVGVHGSDVVTGEVDDGFADVLSHPGVSEVVAGGWALVVALDEADAVEGAEAVVAAEDGEVAVEGVVDNADFEGEIEVEHLGAEVPIAVSERAAGEDFREDKGAVAADVVGIHLGEVGVEGVAAAGDEVPLDVVVEAVGVAHVAVEFADDVFGGVEACAVVVHGIAEPVDPADEHLSDVFRWGLGELVEGVFGGLSGVADEGGGFGGEEGWVVGESVVGFGADINEADEFFLEGEAEAVADVVVAVHAVGAFPAAGLVGVLPNVEVVDFHAGVGEVVGAVAVVVEDEVGVDEDVAVMGVVDEHAEVATGAVTGGEGAALWDFA